MTDTEINIAIAESLNLKYHKPTEEEIRSGSYYQFEPDHCHDLNAMWEIEERQAEIYWRNLLEVVEPRKGAMNTDPWFCMRQVGHATAHQRAEALLRTVGKRQS